MHSDVTDSTLLFFVYVQSSDAEQLGAPLFPGSALDAAWTKRCEDLTRAVHRLAEIRSQDVLILLRASFSAPTVQHLLRCSPSVHVSALQTFDGHLRLAVSNITNSGLSDTQWIQASLPIKYGGLGIRRVVSLALPVFLAAAASNFDLQTQILASFFCPSDSFLDLYLSSWSREDERLSWPGWLTYSGRLSHISGHPSDTGRAQDGERTLARLSFYRWATHVGQLNSTPNITC